MSDKEKAGNGQSDMNQEDEQANLCLKHRKLLNVVKTEILLLSREEYESYLFTAHAATGVEKA